MRITDYAALSQQGRDWTEAFETAIAALKAQGGGTLTVPAGDYPTGSIRLTSHMTLEILSGATVRFHRSADAFPVMDLEFEGVPCRHHQPCLYAEGETDIRVTGGGTLDGQGDFWWPQARAKTLTVARPYLFCVNACRDVVLENLTLRNSPCWTVHPLRSENVVIRGLHIQNPADSPNTDGIDPNGCRTVRIHDCTIDVGDDCIAIKSGTEDTVQRMPSEDIIITNCHFLHGHGGVVLGSEMSGGIRNVLVSTCVFRQTDRGVRLKTRRGRGGAVEGIQLTNLLMEDVMCPFVFNMYYFCGRGGKEPWVSDKRPRPADASTPALRDVNISNVTVKNGSACAGYFYGLPESPVAGIILRDVTVRMNPDAAPDRPAMMEGCPEMQGAGFFLREARDVVFTGVTVTGLKGPLLDADETVEVLSNQA